MSNCFSFLLAFVKYCVAGFNTHTLFSKYVTFVPVNLTEDQSVNCLSI